MRGSETIERNGCATSSWLKAPEQLLPNTIIEPSPNFALVAPWLRLFVFFIS
jgi:hypothetical protein